MQVWAGDSTVACDRVILPVCHVMMGQVKLDQLGL